MIVELFVALVSICFQKGVGTDIVPTNLLKMQQGIGWPHVLHVVKGHEALLKLSSSVENVQSCVVTTPLAETFDVGSPPSSRYESWGGNCGVRVQHVTSEDEGRWRLTVIGDTNLTGWTELYIEDEVDSYSASPISILDGQHTEVELTSLNNSYCLVSQPFAESSLVSGHCHVTLDRANRAVQGDWGVLVGLPGRVSELPVQRKVNVEAERLDVGYVHETSTNKLHIYCNIVHTVKNVTFCRFQMTTAPYGYNVMDGLSDGTHSYYGDGFGARHCGITVESPTLADYGTWRCSVGVKQWVGTQVVQQTPLQALVKVLPHAPHIKRDLLVNSVGFKEVLVEENVSFTLMCYADSSLSYCWFQHPNGSQFTPVEHDDPEQQFWYSGLSLQLGECGITFSHARLEDAGQWTCHMGPNNQLGIEETDTLNLRVTGPLAADIMEVAATIGEEATLYCRTANGRRPLHYCRFLSPNRVGISIDSSVTNESAILDRYYFTPHRELDYGDCSLNINPVTEEDVGQWTCAGLVDDQVVEARDTILLYVQQGTPLSRAGIIGMSVGAAILLVVLAVTVLFKRGYIVYKWRHNISAENPSDMISMDTRVPSPNSSLSSTSSRDLMDICSEAMERCQRNEHLEEQI